LTEVTISNRDKIKYLKRYIILNREIDRKLDEVTYWRARLEKLTATYSTQPQGGGSIYSREQEVIAKIVDLEKEIDADIDRLLVARDGIKAVIEVVEDDRERLLLQYRYIDGLPWERVAVSLNYSWQHTHKLHSQALSKLKMR